MDKDDKLLDLVTKMYSEFTEFKKDITKKVGSISSNVAKLENNLTDKVNILFETREDNYNKLSGKLDIIENKVEKLTEKTDKQDFEIKLIKKKAK